MRAISAFDAQAHLSRLLDEVVEGETITVTKNGVPIAQLIPAPEVRQRSTREVIAALKEFRRGKTLDGVSVRELIEEGRRY